ncbi:hypothetical protein LXA43DRAFT_1099815 [Ganoderma leucocontextum]|nr:hypothetical protein LXA43DRAFT_1099815 [Ganoderma leucocontextum]
MSRTTALPGDRPPNLYSLQDLRRIGPNTLDGLYTLNELGYMLLYLTLLDGGNCLCAECFRMGTGGTPCPHGTFTADTRPAPVLVWPEVLIWPEDRPEDRPHVGRPRSASSVEDLQQWVTVEKAISLPPYTAGLVTDGVSQTASGNSAVEHFSPGPFSFCIGSRHRPILHPAALCSQTLPPENRPTILSAFATTPGFATSQTQASSTATAAAAIAIPYGVPFFSSPPFMNAGVAFSSASPLTHHAPDHTLPKMRTTGLQHVPTSQPTPSPQLATPVPEHAPQHAYYHHDHAQRPALPPSPPGSPGLRGVVPGNPSYFPHFDQYDSGVKHWYVVTVGRTVGVFKDAFGGFESTNGVPGQSWERCETYALAITVFREQEKKNAVVQVQM